MSDVAQYRLALMEGGADGEHTQEVAAKRGREAPVRDEAMIPLVSEADLAALAFALAGPNAPLTDLERALVPDVPASASEGEGLRQASRAIARGEDPLGNAFCRLRPPEVRRKQGAVYTPQPIIDAMVRWSTDEGTPKRIVDPGAGSGRFLIAAGKAFSDAELVAVEIDPLPALLLRANAAIAGMADRLTLHLADYRTLELPEIDGRTLFLGNPPYVRHHEIAAHWKDWMAGAAATRGFKASKLAGLHVHFFVKTCDLARTGDYGTFVTSAEWLDVNYGELLRKLLANGLGGTSLHVIAPTAMPFADAATTGAITCFRIGHRGECIRLRAVETIDELDDLRIGRPVARSRLDETRRWSSLLRSPPRAPRPHGCMSLGELCRVHRGQVTGCNAVWIAGAHASALPPSVLVPAITKARELFDAAPLLSCTAKLRRVINLPTDLEELCENEHRQVQRFLAWAKRRGADRSYIARHRRAWWAVALRAPAPILCTYMARRPPAFVRNPCGARHLNIAHGIYPRDPLPAPVLDALSAWLQDTVCVSSGRTYAGGLTKFEPKEIERIPIPSLGQLYERAEEMDAGGVDR